MDMPPFVESFVKGPRLPKVVLGVVGLLVIVGAGWFLLLSPAQARIDALSSQNAALQTELVKNRAAVAQLAQYRRDLAQLEEQLEALKAKLPTEKETPTLYRSLSDAAHAAGLGVALFQPREPRPREYVNEIPITLTAEGGYHQLGQFFERVALLPRVVTVGEMKVTGLVKARSALKADLTLATYMYRAAPPPAKPGAKPAPVPAPPKPAAMLPRSGELPS